MNVRSHDRGAFERALAFCRRQRLFVAGDRVLVGSGSGVASLGALGFLRLAQSDLGLAEVAVGAVDLGGAEDAESVADAGRFARLLGTTFYAISADGRTPTASLVAQARAEGFNRIALGHTRDDAVARVLAHVTRGRPLARLRPLRARRRDGVVRPLLELRDADALELARTAGIEPPMMPPEPGVRPGLETRLRGSVLPRLRVEVPGVDAALLALAAEARQLMRIARAEAERRVPPLAKGSTMLEVPVVGTNRLLASVVAETVLDRLDVAAGGRAAAIESLARLLQDSTPDRRLSREVVLGPGLVATYVPQQRVVALRIMRMRRAAG